MAIIEHAPGESTIFVQLEQVPVPQSIQLQVGSVVTPPDAYEIQRNILLIAGKNSPQVFERLMSDSGVSIVYLPDPDAKDKAVELKQSGDQILAGKVRLYDGKRTLWPSGDDGPFEND